MIKKSNKLMILLATSLTSFGCASTHTDSWSAECTQSVEHLSEISDRDVIYSPLPKIDQESDTFRLEWSGLSIPIPQNDYTDVVIIHDSNKDLGVILKSVDKTKISVGRFYENQKLSSVFANNSDEVIPPKFSWTVSSLDTSMRTSDLVYLGYETSVSDIDCNPKNKDLAAEKIAAIAIKKSNQDVMTAHKLSFGIKNWVDIREHAFDPNNTYYTANVVDESRGRNEIKQISYVVPKSVERFALYSEISDNSDEPNNPDWLNALSSALSTNSEKDWMIYFDLAKRAGISQKSLNASKSNLFN